MNVLEAIEQLKEAIRNDSDCINYAIDAKDHVDGEHEYKTFEIMLMVKDDGLAEIAQENVEYYKDTHG